MAEENIKGIVRFTMVITEVEKAEDENLLVSGIVRGRTLVGEEAFLLLPNHGVACKILDIETEDKGKVTEIEKGAAKLHISVKADPEKIPKYSVLSSFKPMLQLVKDVPLENPMMLAMSLENRRLGQDNLFRSALLFSFVHGGYLVPMKSDVKPEGGGIAQIPSDAKLTFLTLPDTVDNTKRVLPVFTDWIELHRWRQKANPAADTQTVVLHFPQLLGVMKANEHLSGLVVNPMSTENVLFSRNAILNIESLEAYQNEFVKGIKANAPTPGVPAKLMVPESDEMNDVRRALSDYCLTNPEIVEMHLVLREEQNEAKRLSYYILIETEGDKKATLEGIAAALKGHIKNVPQIDFAFEDEIKKLEGNLPIEALVYRRV